jgi:hypothetical protein
MVECTTWINVSCYRFDRMGSQFSAVCGREAPTCSDFRSKVLLRRKKWPQYPACCSSAVPDRRAVRRSQESVMRFVVPAVAVVVLVPLQYLAPALVFAGMFGLDRRGYARAHALGRAHATAD